MKRYLLIAGIVTAVLSAMLLLITSLPVPRRQVDLDLVSQQYRPGQSMKLRIDMPEYLPVAKDVPFRTELALPESTKPGAGDEELVASARLDAPDLSAQTGETYEALYPAKQASFSWTMNARQPGVYKGVLWIFLQRRGEEGQNHEVLLAHPLELRSRSVANLSAGSALWVGVIGLGLGGGLILSTRAAVFRAGFL